MKSLMVIGIETMAVPNIGINEQRRVKSPSAYQCGIGEHKHAIAATKP